MTVSVGNVALTNVKVKNAGELTGKLRGNLTARCLRGESPVARRAGGYPV